MVTKTVTGDFAAIVAVPQFKDRIVAKNLFDLSYNDLSVSPIDQFIENTLQLTKLWVASGANVTPSSQPPITSAPANNIAPELGILLLLGYVSAVESYMRALIRRLILCDPTTQKACEFLQVSYLAAINHQDELLPEALLEETVFSSAEGITKALQKFLRVEIKDKTILSLLEQYDSLCHLRHCCVHRFGKLGVKNAAALRLLETNKFLEKPVKVDIDTIAIIASLVLVLVKAINNDVFRLVLNRTVITNNGAWSWNIRNDRKLFGKYYSIFSSIKDAQISPDSDVLYERFRAISSKVKPTSKDASAS